MSITIQIGAVGFVRVARLIEPRVWFSLRVQVRMRGIEIRQRLMVQEIYACPR